MFADCGKIGTFFQLFRKLLFCLVIYNVKNVVLHRAVWLLMLDFSATNRTPTAKRLRGGGWPNVG